MAFVSLPLQMGWLFPLKGHTTLSRVLTQFEKLLVLGFYDFPIFSIYREGLPSLGCARPGEPLSSAQCTLNPGGPARQDPWAHGSAVSGAV